MTHYTAWVRHGNPLVVKHYHDPVEGFWAKVDKNGPLPDFAPHLGPCWLWTGSTDRRGYGKFWFGGKIRAVHRLAYEWLVGPIPKPMLDHLCRVPLCLRPEHLDPVTNRENQRRGKHGVLKTHCVNGHEFTPENIYIQPKAGTRSCRVCYEIRGWKRKP